MSVVINGTTGITTPDLTDTNGTANGVVYLNGSKVLTTGSALTFDGTNLGIGTSSPSTKLHVSEGVIRVGATSAGASLGTYEFSFTGSASLASIEAVRVTNNTTSNIIFSTATSGTLSEKMRLDQSGNLGLGVTPSAWNTGVRMIEFTGAAIGSNNTPSQMYLLSNAYLDSGGWKYKITNYAAKQELVNGTFNWSIAGSGTAGNAISWTQAMTLDSSGNLLVGTTDFTATGIGFKVVGGRPTTANAASTNSTTTYEAYSTGASAFRFYVGYGGTVFATSTTISAISDQRLKENVQDLDVGLDAVMALKPRKFDWKQGKGKDTKGDRGFIAQEFEQVFPDMIDEWRDPAPEGEEPYKSVRADLIPVLVKAIQEQQTIIEQLKADVAALKGQA